MVTAMRRPKLAVSHPIDLDKALPSDTTAEAAVLGSILIDPVDALADIAAVTPNLAPRHFTNTLYKKVFTAIQELQEAGQAIDAVLVDGWLRDHDVKDAALLTNDLVNAVLTSAHADTYAQRVYDIARQRAQITTAYQMFQAAWSGDDTTYAELTEKSERLREDFVPAKQRKLKTRNLREIMLTEYPEQRMLVEKVIQQGIVTLLAGKPKAGKSFLLIGVAFAIAEACQEAFASPGYHGLHCQQSDVLYLALEDTERRIKNRAKKMRGEVAVPEGIEIATEASRIDEALLDQLDAYLDEHSNCKLIIIDTLTSVLPPPGKNGGGYLEDRLNMEGLRKLAHDRDVAILPVIHCRKADGADVYDTIQTTMGTQGGAENLVVLQRKRGEDRAVLHVTGNDVDSESLAMKWDKENCTWSILGDADEVAESENEEKIFAALEALQNNEGNLSQVSDKLKGEMVTSYVKTTLYRMASAGKLTNTGGTFKKCAFETSETLKLRNSETPQPERRLVSLKTETAYEEYAETPIVPVPDPEVSEFQSFKVSKVSKVDFSEEQEHPEGSLAFADLLDEDTRALFVTDEDVEALRDQVRQEWERRDWGKIQLAPHIKTGGDANQALAYLARVTGLAGLTTLLNAVLALGGA